MFESNKLHEYDDKCFCVDCSSSEERIEAIKQDAIRQHHTMKHYIQEHPQLALVMTVFIVLMLFFV